MYRTRNLQIIVLSIIKEKITVNLENKGKQVINASKITLKKVKKFERN